MLAIVAIMPHNKQIQNWEAYNNKHVLLIRAPVGRLSFSSSRLGWLPSCEWDQVTSMCLSLSLNKQLTTRGMFSWWKAWLQRPSSTVIAHLRPLLVSFHGPKQVTRSSPTSVVREKYFISMEMVHSHMVKGVFSGRDEELRTEMQSIYHTCGNSLSGN